MTEYPDHVIVCRHCWSPIERFEGVWGRLDANPCGGSKCEPLSVEDYDINVLSRIVDYIAEQKIRELRLNAMPRSA